MKEFRELCRAVDEHRQWFKQTPQSAAKEIERLGIDKILAAALGKSVPVRYDREGALVTVWYAYEPKDKAEDITNAVNQEIDTTFRKPCDITVSATVRDVAKKVVSYFPFLGPTDECDFEIEVTFI